MEISFIILSILMFIISLVIIVLICKRRNIQPLKKKSALLMICSVVGNYMVIFNTTMCCIFFQMVKKKQSYCYFESGDYDTKESIKIGDNCMLEWYTQSSVQFFAIIVEINSHSILPVSENLAIIPYALRSFRIYKLFQAREKSCITDKIPKADIRKLSEYRMLLLLFMFIGLMIIIDIISFTFKDRIYMFASIAGILNSDGTFVDDSYSQRYMSNGCFTMSVQYFFTSLYLFIAIYL